MCSSAHFFACSSPSQVSIALPGNPFCRKGEASRRHFLLGGVHLRFHNHLDSILDSVLGVSDCRWKVVEWKRVGMNLRRVEPFLSHERLGPMSRTLALTPDAVNIDVVVYNMREIHWHFFVRYCCNDTATT